MIFILLILLIILLFLYYSVNRREILSATLFITSIYIIMTMLAISARSYYRIEDISFKAAAIVVFSICFFGFGEYLGKHSYIKSADTRSTAHLENDGEIRFSTVFTLLVTFYSAIVAYWCFVDIMRFATRNGLVGDFTTVFSRLRLWLTRGIVVYERSTLLNQLVILDEALCYMYVYTIVHNLIYKKRVKLVYYLPVIPFFVVMFSTTGRTDFIEFFVVTAFIIFILLKSKTDWSSHVNTKIIRIGIITLVLFYLLFRLAGRATMKSDEIGFGENIYRYFACTIFGFDSFITSNYSNSPYFRAQTLRSFYIILNIFGFKIPLVAQFNPAYNIGNTQTVMLTGLYRPILDYTVFGMLLTRIFVGFLYGVLIKNISRTNPHNFVAIIFIGFVFYPVVMNPLSDLFGSLISFGYIYRFFYLWAINKFVLQKHFCEIGE